MSHFSGVSTLTTPTLTPGSGHQLLSSGTTASMLLMLGGGCVSPPHEAASGNFVPPLPSSVQWHGGGLSNTNPQQSINSDEDEEDEVKPPVVPSNKGGKKRGGGRSGGTTGGRRPKKEACTPEEEDRRRMRRERNKMAAARCRKRRVDQTNLLQEETDVLESSKRVITSKITDLQHEKEELELILQAHVSNCRNNLKLKQGRPTSLPVVPATISQSNSVPVTTGTVLQTPSNGLSFDFDWAGSFPSTGLTPGVGSLTPLMTPGTVGQMLSLIKGEPPEGSPNEDNNMAVL